MNKEDGASPTNPMLYDPIQETEGTGQSRKLMQFVAASIICIGAISSGTALAWTSPVLDKLKSGNDTITISEEAGSWVGAVLAIGALCGALPAGILADMIGRKYTTMSLGAPFILSWIFIISANGSWMLIVGRILAGIATGGFCVVCPMYISEIADVSVRGTLGSFFQLFLTIGILLVYLVGAYCNWIILSYICSIMPILLILTMFIIPESPTYLLKKNRRNEAVVALKWFWGPYSNTRDALQNIQSSLDSVSGKVALKDLVNNRANRLALIICLCLMFFQQFSGINAVIFYANTIFKDASSNPEDALDPALCSIIVGVVQVLMTFVAAVLIDLAGRRILLLQSSVVMGICLCALGIFFHLKDVSKVAPETLATIGWLPLLAIVLFIVSFSLGFGPIPWMIMGELFAPDVKSIASSIAVMLNWTLTFVVTLSFQPMLTAIGSNLTFWFFSAMMVICTIFVAIVVPETKGKSNTEIQLILSVKSRRELSQKYIPMNADL